jgi:hypothetical protein
MRIARSAQLLILLGLGACEQQSPLPTAVASPAARQASAAPSRAQLLEKLRPWLTRQDDKPKKLSQRPCPDEAIRAAASSDDERTLALRAQDGRWEKRSLIPLRVTREVTSPDPTSLESTLISKGTRLDAKLGDQVDWLARRHYVGVFHFLDYSGPRVIHRLNRAKPEWVAGWALTWLVVHDAKSGEALCATQIQVKNDVSAAPLEKRRRSDVTEQLTTALGRKLREAAPAALAKISSELRIEGPRAESTLAAK